MLRARLIWEQVSQALCRPYPPNPSSPVNVYRLLDMFQAITIGVLSEVAYPYLVRYAFCKSAGFCTVRVRYGLRILYSFWRRHKVLDTWHSYVLVLRLLRIWYGTACKYL